MGRLERHISTEILALTLARIERGEPVPTKSKPRPRLKPRLADTYRASWRNAGQRATIPTKYHPVQPHGRKYPYASTKRGGKFAQRILPTYPLR